MNQYIQSSFYKTAGFSLLEMLLVITLLGMMSLAAVVLTEGSDDQARYDDTKNRLLAIKRAIIGDTSRTINGEPEISGFVADMGRLPNCVQELLVRNNDNGDGNCEFSGDLNQTIDLTLWSVQASGVGAGLGAGWRGPYLDSLPSRSGVAAFLDGWGNKWSGVAQSLGRDRAVTDPPDNNFNDDYPANSLISSTDWQVSLTGWSEVAVEFANAGTSKVSIDANDLIVRVNYPDPASDGIFSSTTGLGSPFPDVNIEIPGSGEDGLISISGSIVVTLKSFSAASLSGTSFSITQETGKVPTLEIESTPNKIVRLLTCAPSCTLTLSGAPTWSSPQLTLNNDLTVPRGSAVQIKGSAPTAPIPMGHRSLEVVCDSGDRLAFRGTCPSTNQTLHPSTYFFKAVPRAAPPPPPNPLIWEIN